MLPATWKTNIICSFPGNVLDIFSRMGGVKLAGDFVCVQFFARPTVLCPESSKRKRCPSFLILKLKFTSTRNSVTVNSCLVDGNEKIND